MDDLIRRQDAIDAIQKAYDRETLLNRFVRDIATKTLNNLPSAERKHGEWVTVKGSNGKDYRKCTNCLHTQEITGLLNYCPICGADMKGGKQ